MKKDIKEVIIAQMCDIDPNISDYEFSDSTNLYEDIGMDSLDVMEVVMSLENRHNVKIDNRRMADIATIKDLSDLFND